MTRTPAAGGANWRNVMAGDSLRGMEDFADIPDRRTSADAVFDRLQDDIVSLRLLPGARMSEADIAARFGQLDCKPVASLADNCIDLHTLTGIPLDTTKFKYLSLIGSLMWSTLTRPEVASNSGRWCGTIYGSIHPCTLES